MIERILFLTNYNQYDSKRHFAKYFAEALRLFGIDTLELDVNQGKLNRSHLEKIETFNPTFTASFHSFIPISGQKFLWDMLKKPHLAILVDPVLYSLAMIKSPLVTISCVDLFDVENLLSFGFKKTFFLPHAVPKSLAEEPLREKIYDVTFIGSCYDYETLRKSWEKKLPEGAKEALSLSIELVMNDNATPLQVALVKSWNHLGLSPQGVNFEELFNYLDLYTRGLDRIKLIRSIPGEVKVHVFGANAEGDFLPKNSWEHYLGDKKNVIIHSPVSFLDSLDVLRASKISLNSFPFFKNGTHERLFTGSALGSLVATSDNLWVRRNFIDDEDILIVPPKGWDQAGERIRDVLKDTKKREEMALRGREKTLKFHTWHNRAETLIQEMNQFL